VLSRGIWSALVLSRLLLGLLGRAFLAPDVPLELVVDGTLERRRGRKLAWKGRFHDAVRSQPGHVVTSEGIHRLRVMLLVAVPWCQRSCASAEGRARLSDALAAIWADPGYRANRAAARPARKVAAPPPPRKRTPDARFARWLALNGRRDRPLPATWLPRHKVRWCAAEDAWLLAHDELTALQAATILGRSAMAVWQRRSGPRRGQAGWPAHAPVVRDPAGTGPPLPAPVPAVPPRPSVK
jgi:hypothetical protein